MGELRVDVEQELHVLAPEMAAQARGARAIGAPKPHVGGEEAGEDLAREARPGHRADRHARDRVPEIIDAERRLEMRFGGLDDGGHRRKALGRRFEDIGAIVLVAEHHGVDAARLQALDVGNRAFDQLVEPAVRVVKRRAGQGADVNHGDHDFFRIAKEVEHHGLFPQAHAV